MTAVALMLENINYGGFVPTMTYPGDNCCVFFEREYFDYDNSHDLKTTPRSLKLCHNETREEFRLNELTRWENRIDSYYCGKNVWYDLCDNADPDKCKYEIPIASGAGHIRNPRLSWHNRISSVIMGPYDPAKMGAVTLFHDNDCSGNSARLYWNPDDPLGGVYSVRDMKKAGMNPNGTNSIAIPRGYYAELYDHHGLTKLKKVQHGEWDEQESQYMQCYQTGQDWIDSVIVKREKRGHAVGYWQGITSTETQTYTYHVGTSYTDSSIEHTETRKASYELGSALEMGLYFISAIFGNQPIAPNKKTLVQKDVESTYGLETGIENTTTCTTADGSGAGLWQWIVATEDGAAHSFSWHTVCRTGALAYQEPDCPFFACLDADCSSCAEDWQAPSTE